MTVREQAEKALAAMPEACRKALEAFAMKAQRRSRTFPVRQVRVDPDPVWPGVPPTFIPAEPISIVQEAARMVGATSGGVKFYGDVVDPIAWVWPEGDESPMSCTARSPMAAALGLFAAAWERRVPKETA